MRANIRHQKSYNRLFYVGIVSAAHLALLGALWRVARLGSEKADTGRNTGSVFSDWLWKVPAPVSFG